MTHFIIRRLLLAVPTALVVVGLVFSILHLTPSDPARLVAGDGADQKTVELIRHNLGLDQPLPQQLLVYLGNVVRLDFGRSIHSNVPVRDELAARFPATLELAIAALVIAVSVGTMLGMLSALRPGTTWDFGSLVLSTVLVSAPSFWLGLVLILFFAVRLGWLPAAGYGGPEHLVLPALALAGYPLALTARMVRAGCLDVLSQDFVRTARAKGLRERLVISRHVMRNALLPVITVIGLQLGHALGGAVVIETVFAWPGIGRLVIDAIFQRDFPIVQGGLLVIGLAFVLMNLLVDLTYAYIDPRIRYS
jgi:ABC-type dipeptide/oligopeptide/nickel transport system permease component